MEINVSIGNINKISSALRSSPEIMGRHLDTAIKESIYLIEADVVPRTPVDKGDLRRSLQRGVRFSSLYGEIGSNLKYALKQHESLHFRHIIGEAKYLENAVIAKTGDIKSRFDARLEAGLKEIAGKAS